VQPPEQTEHDRHERVRKQGAVGPVGAEAGGKRLTDFARLSRSVSWAHDKTIGLAESQLDAIGPGREGRTAREQMKFALQLMNERPWLYMGGINSGQRSDM
jgi:hypothetical protein